MSAKGWMPYDGDSELTAVGAVLVSKPARDDIFGFLHPDDFYNPANREVFKVAHELYVRGEDPSELSVLRILRTKEGVDPKQVSLHVGECIGQFGTLRDGIDAAENVHLLGTQRRLLSAAHEIEKLARKPETDDIGKVLDEAEQLIFSVADHGTSEGPRSVSDDLAELLELLETGHSDAVPTGLSDFDRLVGGFRPGQMIVVGARPSMGKSALLTDFMVRSARLGRTSVIFSYEMSKEELDLRILSQTARVPLETLVRRDVQGFDWEGLSKGAAKINEWGNRIKVVEAAGMGLAEIQASCRRMAAKKELDMVLIDYLQLMTPPRGASNREQEVAQIARSLKLMSQQLKVPVVVAAQLNRKLEDRGDKRPILSDLRESGAIEQDADVVVFLYRASVYDEAALGEEGVAELLVRKQRNGPTGTVLVQFDGKFTSFNDLANAAQIKQDRDERRRGESESKEEKVSRIKQQMEESEVDDMLGPRNYGGGILPDEDDDVLLAALPPAPEEG